jgi:hypothetical protein
MSNVMRSGEWLLNPQLLNKKLDVRIKGTNTTLWHNGRYEGECGIVILNKKVSSVKDSVIVKVGYNQSKASFQLRYVYPEITTERPRFVSPSSVKPIVDTIGEWVVIIGADMEGKTDLIGNYAVVVYCQWPLELGYACVQVLTPERSEPLFHYFPAKSLCRSHEESFV